MLKIGFDIGGTKIAAMALNAAGECVRTGECPTPPDFQAFCHAIRQLMREVAGGQPVEAIGLGVPGAVARDAVTRDRGRVLVAVNVPYLAEQDVGAELERFLGFPVKLANDADCFALSEALDGAGKDKEVVLGLILGTGVGAGLVVRGQLVQGKNGLTGEWAHVPLPWRKAEDPSSLRCPCGKLDCCNEMLSARGLIHLARHLGCEISKTEELLHCPKPMFDRVISHYADMLARSLVIPVQMLDPDIVVLGGGLAALEDLFRLLPEKIKPYMLSSNYKLNIVPAKHGPRSGLRGAAFL